MSWYAIDAVDRALSRTRKALFEPFDFWKWVKLAIIIFLLGGIGSNYGGSSNYHPNSQGWEKNLPNVEPDNTPEPPFSFNSLYLKEVCFNLGILENSRLIHNLVNLDSGIVPDYFSNGIATSVENSYFLNNSLSDYGLLIALAALFFFYNPVFYIYFLSYGIRFCRISGKK